MPHAAHDADCIESCSACAQTCYSSLLNHCLEAGGQHIEPNHVRLMLDCVKVCETCASLQLSRSPFSAELCRVCAAVCDACAASCEAVGDMEACVAACRRCVESCRRMAA